MTWRYVMAREAYKHQSGEVEETWSIRELYTDEDGKLSWTKEAIDPCGETWIELGDCLGRMTAAVTAIEYLDLTLEEPRLVTGRPRRNR